MYNLFDLDFDDMTILPIWPSCCTQTPEHSGNWSLFSLFLIIRFLKNSNKKKMLYWYQPQKFLQQVDSWWGEVMVKSEDGEHWSVVQPGWVTLPAAGNMLSCDPVTALLKCFLATRCSCGTNATAVLRQMLGTIALQVARVTHSFKGSAGGNSRQNKNATSSSRSRAVTDVWWVGKYEILRDKRHPDHLPWGTQTISHQETISNI